MKALVFLLVLGNLLFYAFTAGYFGHSGNPDANRLDAQLVPERIRIVSRGEAPDISAPPKSPAPEVPPVVSAPKAESTAPVCLAWNALTPADADRLGALLAGKFADFKLDREVLASEGVGWWVFVPPLPNKADAEKKAGELRQLGISDYFIIQEGINRFAISLGVFSSEKGGQERLSELRGKGVRSARLAPRSGKDSTVNVQATGPAASRAALVETVGKSMPKLEARGCK